MIFLPSCSPPSAPAPIPNPFGPQQFDSATAMLHVFGLELTLTAPYVFHLTRDHPSSICVVPRALYICRQLERTEVRSSFLRCCQGVPQVPGKLFNTATGALPISFNYSPVGGQSEASKRILHVFGNELKSVLTLILISSDMNGCSNWLARRCVVATRKSPRERNRV